MVADPAYITGEGLDLEIVRLAGLLEDATTLLATVSEEHANADADYRFAYAQAFLRKRDGDEKLTDKIREQRAALETTEEYRQRRITEAKQMALQEKCRQLRAQLDAVRTVSANLRVQT